MDESHGITFSLDAEPSQSVITEIRVRYVEVMLTYDDDQLLDLFSKAPDLDAFPKSAFSRVLMPRTESRLVRESFFKTETTGGYATDNTFRSKVIWDYL